MVMMGKEEEKKGSMSSPSSLSLGLVDDGGLTIPCWLQRSGVSLAWGRY